jgi:hypothetical protein
MVIALVGLVVACGDSATDSRSSQDAGAGLEASSDAAATSDATVQPPVGCDPAAEPKDAPKCVVSDFGVFVDATNGADANAGTKDAPVRTIAGALGKLSAKNRIYICEGTYAEHVELTSAVSLYGGFACGAWTYSGTKAKVAPTNAGYALQVGNVSSPSTLSDLAFTAIPGTDATPSSVAAFVTKTTSLTLRRVDLVAGAGFKGKTPNQGSTLALMSSMPTAGTLNGNAGNTTIGGAAQLCTCVGGGTSRGGAGGNINGDGSAGVIAQAVADPAFATGLGSTFEECGVGQGGRPGSNAPSAAGAAGASTLGAITENGWSPSSGSDGVAGTPGQGGGGGGGAGGGGGGGACGGCGGEGGRGGGGGGASIALASLASPVALVASSLTSADAGEAGAGGGGGDGGAGGAKARGGLACDGGNGGKGGAGGGGGGGAGGISVGVLYKGAKPTLDTTKTTTGRFGAKGVGAGLDGIDGQKADILEFP